MVAPKVNQQVFWKIEERMINPNYIISVETEENRHNSECDKITISLVSTTGDSWIDGTEGRGEWRPVKINLSGDKAKKFLMFLKKQVKVMDVFE